MEEGKREREREREREGGEKGKLCACFFALLACLFVL